MTGEPSDEDFARRALALLPPIPSSPGFERTVLAGFDARQARRGFQHMLNGFCDLVWPGAPRWALAGAFTASLLAGMTLGATLPTRGEEAMAFSLDRTPGFSLLPSDTDEDL